VDHERSDALRSLLRVRGYRPLLANAVLWHSTRWGGLFSGSYLMTQLTNAPILNQLAGACLVAPMLLGGMAAGSLSDRVDRRRFILATQLALIPPSILMFVLVDTERVRAWMLFPFMAVLGIGGVVNMTAQRPLVYDTVGPQLAPRALTIEAVGGAAASVFGSLTGGALIALFGIGAAFLFTPAALSVSAILITCVPTPTAARPQRDDMTGRRVRGERGRGRMWISILRDKPALTSMLGITVLMNVLFFSFTPLIPVIAESFQAGPLLTGLLAAAAGCGQLVAGAAISVRQVHQRGRLYAYGTGLAMAGLALFAFAPVVGLALIALVVAGVGQAGFSTMQSVLAIESVGADQRGIAQGLLSTAVGAAPVGMVALGAAAQLLGPRPALVASSVTGLLMLGLWLSRRPHVLRIGAALTQAV
jgi:MFS family permease